MLTKNNYSNHYYLLDTSAFCRFIEDRTIDPKDISHNIAFNIVRGCFYYIPQFCVAEVFNTFARWHYAENKISADYYAKLCSYFRTLVRDRLALYSYDLHRYHILNCDKIYETEHTTPRKKKRNEAVYF